MIDRSRPRVVFLGTHGQHNIGDELLLETFLQHFGDDLHYVVNTYDPAFTGDQLAGRYSVTLVDTAGDRAKLLRHLLGADRLVFGGGSIVKELYASTGRNRYSTLLMILAIVTFARRVARLPVAMFNIGVGPITTSTGQWLARLILRQVDIVTVRDPGSQALCASLGIEARLAADAVFSVDPGWLIGEAAPALAGSDTPLRIGLNLNYDIENPDNWDHFTGQLAEALRQLAETRPIELHALPMQSRFKKHDDARMLRDFARRIPHIPFVHDRPATYQDAARLIAGCHLVVSERLHAVVMASLLGVPTFVLAYDTKVRELAMMLGLDEYTVDINRPFPVAAIEAPLRRLCEDLGGARERLIPNVARLSRSSRQSLAEAHSWVRSDRASRRERRHGTPSSPNSQLPVRAQAQPRKEPT